MLAISALIVNFATCDYITMEHKQYVTKLAKKTSLDYKETASLLQSVTTAIADLLSEGDTLMLPSFGSFSTVKHDESIITDISTGKHMLMPPCIEVEFTPSNILNKHIAANE